MLHNKRYNKPSNSFWQTECTICISASGTLKHQNIAYHFKKTEMVKIIRTDSGNQDFIKLVKYLDAYLAEKDGQDHSFYAQFNKIDKIKHIVVAYEGDKSVGCGAIKEYSLNTMEIKRMYTLPESRGKGIATKVLNELEIWATELGYEKCILETGKRQSEAIELYKKNGYTLIPNYGQYVGIENSLCFEKEIKL
jgi:putative acetyltransferase